jgi:optic atrophy protein 1
MMKTTANTLRQYIMNVESKRLEMEIKDTLDDFSSDEEKKETLLTGRRVTLAEEIRKVRQIQDKLRVFIAALNQEK